MVNFGYFFHFCPRIFKSGVLVLSFGGCSFHPFCVDRSLSICVFAPNWISHVCVSVRGVLFVFSLFVSCVCVCVFSVFGAIEIDCEHVRCEGQRKYSQRGHWNCLPLFNCVIFEVFSDFFSIFHVPLFLDAQHIFIFPFFFSKICFM